MHDIPYVQNENIGPEVIASMARVSQEIKQILPTTIPCGLQVLASANCQAIAIAKATNLQFIRAEGFVFSHIADEGFTDACAGHLLRYRKQIDAENILIFTDLKKKHSSHAITNDVSLLETVHAAEFFLTDGIILTGRCHQKLIYFKITFYNTFSLLFFSHPLSLSFSSISQHKRSCDRLCC